MKRATGFSAQVIAWLLIAVIIVRQLLRESRSEDFDAIGGWMFFASLLLLWVSWAVLGIYHPLALERKGHEKEFSIILTITGVAFLGFGYLVAYTFH